MGRYVLIITVGWSLMGAPMLCRAGVLVRCCAPSIKDQGPVENTDCENGCCSRPNGEAPVQDGDERECDSCVALCKAVAKPIDDDPLPGRAGLATPTIVPSLDTAAPSILMWALAIDRPPDKLRLPFPSSDIPLLI